MSLLGVDIGTTGCKAAAFSIDKGTQLAAEYREYRTLRPQPDWAELDSLDVISKIKETIARVAAHTKDDPITALCISSMGEAMVPVSQDREILGNSILMTDMRGGGYIEKLASEIGQEDFYKINPNILGTYYSLPKLLWLRDNSPGLYSRAHKFLIWGDLVPFLFGCEPLTSHSLANRTLLYDIHKENWSGRLLEWSGIDSAKLPACVPSGTIAGTVSDTIASELGLPRGVKVVVGGHDQCCNSLGAGITRPGRAVCGIGTVECITPTYGHIPRSTEMLQAGLNVEHHVLPGLYVSFIYNQSGVLLRWFRDTFARREAPDLAPGENIYDLLADEMPEQPTRLLVLPHFQITGPPDFLADSAGAIVGLKTSTTRGEIFKAFMESSTFYFVDSINQLRRMGIDTSGFVATGGGAKSSRWLQIKADVFGVPFVRPKITECGILGAAILAGVSTGAISNPEEGVERFVRLDRTFEPDPERHAIYQDLYSKYLDLYPSLKKVHTRL